MLLTIPFSFRFGGKEEYMTFMNDFVDREFSSMRTFLQQISVSSTGKITLLIFSQKEAKTAEAAFWSEY